ncbi:MAG: uncharacterized protein JWP43_804 [Ramlibacter sp.]|nr:uncharacterized protein [Ramlibacter sp.]
MTKLIAMGMVLMLAACGGGGDGSASSVASPAPAVQALKGKPAASTPDLVPQPSSVVNTTIPGNQLIRSLGALDRGGYTVAWISDGTGLFIQRYDSAGKKVGGETAVQLNVSGTAACTPGVCDAAAAIRDSSVAVLADGSVVVAYEIDRPAGQVGAFNQFKQGIYIQRFSADGVQLAGETTVFSRLELLNSRPEFLSVPTVRALTDGGFVVAWNTRVAQLTNASNSQLLSQRYDEHARPVGGTVTVGSFLLQDQSGRGFTLTADASAGYTLTVSHLDLAFQPIASAIHYDADNTGTQIVAPRSGSVFLLPLQDDRFVLITTDSSGSFLQFLDQAGKPVGAPTPVPPTPIEARELKDGSFVVFWNPAANLVFQRFDRAGARIGNLQTIATKVSVAAAAALQDGGFALGWSGPGANIDLDVFTTQFIEAPGPDHGALRAKRKACLDSAKGMKGQQRKAFVDSCLAA